MSLKSTKLSLPAIQKQFVAAGALFCHEGVVTSGKSMTVAAQEIEIGDRFHGNSSRHMFAVKADILDRDHAVFGQLWEADGRLKDMFGNGLLVVSGATVTVSSLSRGKGAEQITGASLRTTAMKHCVRMLKKYDADYAKCLNKDGRDPSGTHNTSALVEEVRTMRYNKDLLVREKNSEARSTKKKNDGTGASLTSPGTSGGAAGGSDAESDDGDSDDDDGDDVDSTRVKLSEEDSEDEQIPANRVMVKPTAGYIPPFFIAWMLFAKPSADPLSCLMLAPSAVKSRAAIKLEAAKASDAERSSGNTGGLKGQRGRTEVDKTTDVRIGFLKQEETNTKVRVLEARIASLASENSGLGLTISAATTTLESPYFPPQMKEKAAAKLSVASDNIDSNVAAMATCRAELIALQEEMTVDLTKTATPDAGDAAPASSIVYVPAQKNGKKPASKKQKTAAAVTAAAPTAPAAPATPAAPVAAGRNVASTDRLTD